MELTRRKVDCEIEIAAWHNRLRNSTGELHHGISETVGIEHIRFYGGVRAFVCGGAYANF